MNDPLRDSARLRRDIEDVAIPLAAKATAISLWAFLARRVPARIHLGLLCWLAGAVGVLILARRWAAPSTSDASVLMLVPLGVGFAAISEEFAHAAACIRNGKTDCVRSLRIVRWCLTNRIRLTESVGIHLQGRMTPRELLEITAAGPLFGIVAGTAFVGAEFAISALFLDLRTSLVTLCIPVLVPALSLTPAPSAVARYGVVTDGNRIRGIRLMYGISRGVVLATMGRGLWRVFQFALLGSPPQHATKLRSTCSEVRSP